jgi:predicted small integral membrane protein
MGTSIFDLAWMAWTPATGLFFGFIATCLVTLTVLALKYPETERVGVLRIATTRGDRLFISLLLAAFIHLGWIALVGVDTIAMLPVGEGIEVSRLWLATLVSILTAGLVFRFV